MIKILAYIELSGDFGELSSDEIQELVDEMAYSASESTNIDMKIHIQQITDK